MPCSRQRPGQVWLWLLTLVLLLLFGGLTVLQMVGARRDRADLARQAAEVVVPPSAAVEVVLDGWPQWRGQRRDGIAVDSGLASTWPDDGPRQVWEAPTGEGFSGIACTRGRVFTLVQDGPSEALVCWDAATGKERWRYAYPCQYSNGYGNGPRATPTVAGEHVYIVGATGLMHCLKAFEEQPALVWRKDLRADFKATEPQWGVAFSPLVEGDLVYVQPGGPDGNSIAALHKDTGAVVWKKLDHPPSYSSPIAGTLAGRRQVLFFTGTHLVGVTPEAGELLWEFPWPTNYHANIATPIVAGDFVFISSGYDQGCALLRIEAGGSGCSARSVYANRRMRSHFSTPVLYRGHLYGFDDAMLVCLDIASGQVRWKERGFDKGSLLIADDKLFIYGANGVLALADVDATAFREKARCVASKQQTSCWTPPTLADGRLFIRDQTKLTCYDVK
jgi:outer membrane protein assembly factor BamB